MDDERRVIVIGSGPVGAIAAHTLVHKGIPVTMLEAGRRLQHGFLLRLTGRNLLRLVPRMTKEKDHAATGDPETRWFYNQFPGGLSNQWTGAVPRYSPEDFYDGRRLHESYEWPLTYNELVPYYETVERMLNITAQPDDAPQLPAGHSTFQHRLPEDWQQVAQAASNHGQGLTTLPLADGPPVMVVSRGTAFNSFVRLVQPLQESAHFQLITGAHALRVEWNPAKGCVDAVVYQDARDGSQHRLQASAVIIACGTLHTTKLLFNSACQDFTEGLGNTEGLLGTHLHDHPKEWWVFDTDKPLTLLSPSAYLTRLPYATSPPLLANSWTLGTVSLKDKVLSRFSAKSRSVSVQVFGTMIPSARHYARPSPTQKDAYGLPHLELCIRYEEDVQANMHQARQHLLCLMEEAGYHAAARDVIPQLFPGESVHFGGTARMHHSRKYGVTNAWNRLHDIPNVVVCDASCFTTCPEKNPTLTAMAIAARAADRLADDLKVGDTFAAAHFR